MKTPEEICTLIFIDFCIIVRNESPSCAANAGRSIKQVDPVISLDGPAAYGCSMMCWLLERSRMASSIHHAEMWGKQDIDVEH
jgi:hypothetical protein